MREHNFEIGASLVKPHFLGTVPENNIYSSTRQLGLEPLSETPGQDGLTASLQILLLHAEEDSRKQIMCSNSLVNVVSSNL